MKLKMVMALMVMMTAVSAKAAGSQNGSGSLIVFKMMIGAVQEQNAQLIEEVRARALYYNELNYFNYKARFNVLRENCASIQAAVGSQMLSLGTIIEQAKPALESTPSLNTPEADVQLNKLHVYIAAAKEAYDKCGEPTKSVIELRKADAALRDVNAFLNRALP